MRGFKLYYESFDTSPLTGCPAIDPNPTTKSKTTTTKRPAVELGNLQASPTYSLQICLGGQSKFVEAPQFYEINVEKAILGTTQSGNCDPYTPAHCTAPADVKCTFQGKTD
jgi:hypothetical protein